MHLTPTHEPAFVIKPCSIWASPPGCVHQSWWVCVLTILNSTARIRVFWSEEKAEANVVFRCGRRATRALRAWLAVRGAVPTPEVFLNARGQALTTSGFSYIVKKHARVATQQCSSLSKKEIAPHVLRHTCALISLQATGDIRKVAMWLGHSSLKSTEIYLRADPTEKLNTIEKALPPDLCRGMFPVEDKLIAWLSGRKLSGVNPWEDATNSELPIQDSS